MRMVMMVVFPIGGALFTTGVSLSSPLCWDTIKTRWRGWNWSEVVVQRVRRLHCDPEVLGSILSVCFNTNCPFKGPRRSSKVSQNVGDFAQWEVHAQALVKTNQSPQTELLRYSLIKPEKIQRTATTAKKWIHNFQINPSLMNSYYLINARGLGAAPSGEMEIARASAVKLLLTEQFENNSGCSYLWEEMSLTTFCQSTNYVTVDVVLKWPSSR